MAIPHHELAMITDDTAWICERATALGFDLCGVAPAVAYRELDGFPEWLARGYAGEMKYLEDARRRDPRLTMDGARSMIVVAMNYNTAQPHSSESTRHAGGASSDSDTRGWISRYAWGDDYHQVLKTKLDTLLEEMKTRFAESFDARAYVDTGPVHERVAAKYAGLGWLAKNTCLINQQLGSWLFLGVITTTLDLPPTLGTELKPSGNLCGSCTRCLDACPTDAFPEPYVLDATRCISYLTIELRGAIPKHLRAAMGDAVVGCDICQDVCPWNRKAPVSTRSEFQARRVPLPGVEEGVSLVEPPLEALASLSQEEFSAIFRNSAAKRTKWRGLVRNACVALGNSQVPKDSDEFERIVELLQKLAASSDTLIADHAEWALSRLRESVTS
jgi:epoxyqueuosine reductase